MSSVILARLEQAISLFEICGEVSEWLKELAWKACIREIVSRVRISPSPPYSEFKPLMYQGFFFAYSLSYVVFGAAEADYSCFSRRSLYRVTLSEEAQFTASKA